MICKAPRPLDRSDPQNDNNNGPPSIQQMLGLTVLESPHDVVDNIPPCTTSGETSKENSITSHEDPFLPPLTRQRAATVVPEQNMSKKVALTEPVAHPHPPPSPSPEEEGHTTPDLDAQSSHHVPEPKTDCVELSPDMPDQNGSHQVSESTVLQNLELCMDAVSNNEGNLLPSSMPEADSPSVLPHSSNDDNNNPTAADPEAADASHLSTDSIDFFSAREKFQCLSQDSQPRSLTEPTTVRLPQSRCTPPLEGLNEEVDEVRMCPCFKYLAQVCHER